MPTRPPRSAASSTRLSRRDVLRGAAAAGALAAVPRHALAVATASDEPEIKDVRIGFIAVQSAASLIAAHEKGFFKRHGLNATLVKESSWAAARDKIVSGENHGTHLKYAQAVGGWMGVLGAKPTPTLAPLTLARSGSVFMAASALKGRLSFDPASWKAELEEFQKLGEPFTIALPAPMGWHGLMYRHFLAKAGIHADKDMKVITLPPAQMVQNMKVGTMQACAMVEPWGARGVSEKVSFVCMYGHEMWKDHPIKSFSVMEAFADENPNTMRAMLAAIHEAAQWCDDFGNREELAKMLSVPSYMNSPVPAILEPLLGHFNWGDGRTADDPDNAIRYARAIEPQPREVKWFAAQFRRWGMIAGTPDYDAVAASVARPDLYSGACRALGQQPPAENNDPITFWDGTVFDPKAAEEHATSFPVNSLKS